MPVKIKRVHIVLILALSVPIVFGYIYMLTGSRNVSSDPATLAMQQPYLDFVSRVYDEMDKNYYKPVSRAIYEAFIEKYKQKYLSGIRYTPDRTGRLAHLGAGLLVNELKDPEDTFTNFVPPKEAAEYAKKIYGYEDGLGISGDMAGEIFLIANVEARSDAYKQGIRAGNVILAINDTGINALTREQIDSFLYPPLGSNVKLTIAIVEKKEVKTYDLVCEEYFKETITDVPTGIEGVHYFKINKFNRETATDLKGYIEKYGADNIEYMVLDVMDNPGGPPLAVREITALFLPAGDKLFYYKKKNEPEFGLVCPPSDVKYNGRLVVLVDKKSGSSSELLAGTLKAHRRAMVMGQEPTAGSAFLKGATRFEDGSMLALITGEAFLFDWTLLGADGVEPNYVIPASVSDVPQFVLTQIKMTMFAESNRPQQ
jgi:carboxyl-terminal processing protease